MDNGRLQGYTPPDGMEPRERGNPTSATPKTATEHRRRWGLW